MIKNIKRFISFSGGVESTTMCLLYGKGAIALVADTGDEEEEMYERWKHIEQMLKVIHDNDFEIKYLQGEVLAKGIVCHTLDELAMAWKYFPSPRRRYCTARLKIEPIDNFLANQGECELLIGFNADENPGTDREGNWMKCDNVSYRYPLHEEGYTREDCIELLIKNGLMPNFPPYMQRGGCRKCPFRTKKEAKAKYFFNREGFLQDMEFEKKLQDNRKTFYGINMNFPEGYESVMKECEQELSFFGEAEIKSMYKNIKGHEPCGAFCHR